MKTAHTDMSRKKENDSIPLNEVQKSGKTKMKKIFTGFIIAAAVMAPYRAQAAVPVVDNNGGASSILSISATLNGTLTSDGGAPTDVSVYWGSADGGTIAGAWNHVDHFGTSATGSLSQDVLNLTPNKQYYYRFFATNSTGSAWASATTNFQTQASSGPLPVDLGEAAHFTILAGAAVTTTGGGTINGDVGAYPIDGASIAIPPTQVNGIIYARDASGTQASNVVIDADLLLRAKNDMHTAWVDAAGRTPVPSGDRLNPQGGNLGGLTLAPGLYKITSVAYITGSDLTLVGGPDDVWIFMCAQNLEVGSGIKVILAGGAQSRNIFWQVGTSATLGTGSVFKGTIIADQAVTMLSTSTMEGRALAFSDGVTFNGTGGALPPPKAPFFTDISATSTHCTLVVRTTPYFLLTLETTPSLLAPDWTPIDSATPTNNEWTFTDDTAPSITTQRYYRAFLNMY